MPTWLMKTGDDEYVMWSTVVDAPVSGVMSRDEALAEYGDDCVCWTDEHLCSCRARLGEGIRMQDGKVEVFGGRRLAYHFDTYDDVRRFMRGP